MVHNKRSSSMRRVLPLTIPLIAGILISGCGSTQSNTSQIRTTVNQFTVDLGQGHYQQACKDATGSMKSDCRVLTNPMLTPAQCQGAGSSLLGQACGQMSQLRATLGTFTGLTISKLVIQGRTATVTFNNSTETVTLAKDGNRWLVSGA